MDFNDSPAEAAFRAEARAWLQANAPSRSALSGRSEIELARCWQKRKFDAGWACIAWPREYGGRGASAVEQFIWEQEESEFATPPDIFSIGHGMAAPTLMTWADNVTKARFLPRLASGEEIWCQLFSEPSAGSDLAALRTRAVRQGDDWLINGQKIWTSRAHFADYGILVVRTDATVPKHRGLTYFYLDMKSPGIEIRPIRQFSGDADFNEVFFTDLRIPDSQRLGAVGQGWQVSLTTLMNERASIGPVGTEVDCSALFHLARQVRSDGRPALEDAGVRAKLADWYCQEAGWRFTAYRTLSALSRGEVPGPENSIGKLVVAAKIQDMASFAIDLLGQSGVVWERGAGDAADLFQTTYMHIPGLRIAGGTDEVLTNIIAERVLGLPQDIRVDKSVPFDRVPTGADVR